MKQISEFIEKKKMKSKIITNMYIVQIISFYNIKWYWSNKMFWTHLGVIQINF